jgi:hypothetical protein
MNTNLKPLSWAPYDITHVEASVEEPRTGFIGRAAAMRINDIECIVVCQTPWLLEQVGRHLTGKEFNRNLIYKATVINSVGIEVAIPPAPQETPPAPPIVPEVQPTPTTEAEEPATPVSDIPVRKDDGLPVATYKALPVEEDDEL